MENQEALKDLHQTGIFMKENDLVWGTAGNISVRTDDTHFYVSASGTYVGDMGIEDFTLCSFDGSVQGKKPSKEHIMHKGIYEERPDIGAILHASPFYSTMAACSNIELPSSYFVEAMYYLERIERLPYYHPGSKELAQAVKEKASAANVLLLENHGIIVYDTNLKEAKMALQTLEYAARMHITAISGNIPMKNLSAAQEESFLKESGYKPVRNWS
ncbi:class II aldolase/adducin family protein [Sinobaca sp. H24]|uniref:class II aldolase/adducin family protein n=1 Tax=Sinobaca sp. H24 TaxID=2923376 RepID=UPI00207AC20D|nr:class II aldolase/adducin family protein [Sinobaca sp. H24]